MARRYLHGAARPTLAEVREVVRARTPGLPERVTVSWLVRPHAIEYPTGLRGYAARVRLEAPGFRAHDYLLLGDDSGWRMA